jgi:hypothetical protein
MGLRETAAGFAACLVALAAAAIVDRRPYRPGKPNLVWLMIVLVAACLILGRHLLTLLI